MPKTKNLPVLPLRDIVVFPDMVAPLFVGRDKSVRALEMIEEADNEIMLVAQLDAAIDDPGSDDVHGTGTIATILQLLKLPDGTVKVLVEGKTRARVNELIDRGDYFEAEVEAGRSRHGEFRRAGPDACRAGAVRELCEAEPQDPAGIGRHDLCDDRCRPPGRLGRIEPLGQTLRQAGTARTHGPASSGRWRRPSASTISTSR
jgi:acylphosphatase